MSILKATQEKEIVNIYYSCRCQKLLINVYLLFFDALSTRIKGLIFSSLTEYFSLTYYLVVIVLFQLRFGISIYGDFFILAQKYEYHTQYLK